MINKKLFYSLLKKIKSKVINFNETINFIINFKIKGNNSLKGNLTIPFSTKRKIKIFSFVSTKANYKISKLFSYRVFNIKKSFLLSDIKIKRNNFVFFDLDAYKIVTKKNNFLFDFIKKKKIKVDFLYGNVSNKVFDTLKSIKEGRLILFKFSEVLNIPIGTIGMKKKEIFLNLKFLFNYIYRFFYVNNMDKKNISSVYLKSTQGKSYFINRYE